MALIEKQITDHSSGMKRVLKVVGFATNDDTKEVNFFYRIDHTINDVDVPIVVPNKDWKVDNSYNAIMRDENFDPIPNPDYDAEYEVIGYDDHGEPVYGEAIINEEEQYLTMPAYDYFKTLTWDNSDPISIPFLLNWYIGDNDAKGFFDFY